ncbi:MAG: GNAT family N-acetyltransferase [Candidatus Kapabacteria bacterium]|nr:GNAT family N-acetyltransferase [Candidatus Kapabacteria bacterium]
MLIIQQIHHGTVEYEETVALRNDVLRRPLGLAFTPEMLASEVDEFHIACYRNSELVGCLLLVPRNGGKLKMRQVAVAESAQRSGIGKAMVDFSEHFAREHGFNEITMHARETAVPFYLNLGYEIIGDRFEEVSIPHFKMRKSIGE